MCGAKDVMVLRSSPITVSIDEWLVTVESHILWFVSQPLFADPWTSTVSSCLPINYTQIMYTQSTQSIMSRVYYVNYQKTVEFVRTILLVCWCKRNGDVDRAILIGGPDINMKLYFIYSAILCRWHLPDVHDQTVQFRKRVSMVKNHVISTG